MRGGNMMLLRGEVRLAAMPESSRPTTPNGLSRVRWSGQSRGRWAKGGRRLLTIDSSKRAPEPRVTQVIGPVMHGFGSTPCQPTGRQALVLPKLEAADVASPLYELLARIADPDLDDRYRDMLRIAVMPFVHARPRSDMQVKPLHQCTDDELIAVRDAEAAHRRQVELAKRGRHLRLVKGSAR
jgi:hypothetical protein